MNWGNKLLLVFVFFAVGISFLVYRCMQTPVDLVSHDYYKDELAYQQVIDATKKANALTGKVTLQEQAGIITLRLPSEMKNRPLKGSITFYCPSDISRDRDLPLLPNGDGRQVIDAGHLLAGHYAVKVRWECEGNSYFNEQSFDIP
jgi:nitrogen fixation protein FixH